MSAFSRYSPVLYPASHCRKARRYAEPDRSNGFKGNMNILSLILSSYDNLLVVFIASVSETGPLSSHRGSNSKLS